MELLKSFIDFFIHLDHHMAIIVQDFGVWTYLILFLIIFCETGLVATPFLPGDSLLFVVGALAAKGALNLELVLVLLCAAAVLGDTVNYWIGKLLAPKVFSNTKIRFLKKEYLDRTHQFYEKYGAKTIVFARFVPIVRTFAPFIAGVGKMSYGRFLSYNVFGGILWVGIFVFGGYFFGNIQFVKDNFSWVIIGIIAASIIPIIIEFYRHKKKKV